VAQISGTREQGVLNGIIRDTLKKGVLGAKEMTVTALTPVWLDSKSRGVRDYYREGMVMERWDPETRKHDRFVIDRVTASSNMLTLRDKEGERLDLKVSPSTASGRCSGPINCRWRKVNVWRCWGKSPTRG
jgi:ATP-dependent exoDNAse (exonuclease V) alpha subunit